MFTVGFTGTQDGMTLEQMHTVALVLSSLKPDVFRHGDCVGADEEAFVIASALGAETIAHPSNVEGKRAFTASTTVHEPTGPLARDVLIVEDSNLLVAAPSTYVERVRSGTWFTVRCARKVGVPLTVILPDGTGWIELPVYGERRG